MLSSRLARGNNFTSFFRPGKQTFSPGELTSGEMIAYHTKWYMNTDDSIVFKNLRDLIFFQTSMDSFRWLPCLELKNCWNVSSLHKHFPRNQNIGKTKTFRDISFRKQSLLSGQMVHLRECKRRENKHSPRYSCFFFFVHSIRQKKRRSETSYLYGNHDIFLLLEESTLSNVHPIAQPVSVSKALDTFLVYLYLKTERRIETSYMKMNSAH